MTQIPDINLEALDQYDQRLLEPSSAQRLGEKKRKDQFKKLIAGTVGVITSPATRGRLLFRFFCKMTCSKDLELFH